MCYKFYINNKVASSNPVSHNHRLTVFLWHLLSRISNNVPDGEYGPSLSKCKCTHNETAFNAIDFMISLPLLSKIMQQISEIPQTVLYAAFSLASRLTTINLFLFIIVYMLLSIMSSRTCDFIIAFHCCPKHLILAAMYHLVAPS